MKKMLVVMLVALCAVFSVNAIGPEFGVKAGVTFGNIAYGDSDNPYMELDNPLKMGLTGGIMMEMPFGPIALGAEVLYTQKGEKYSWSGEGEDLTMYFKADYIEIPVMAKLSLLPMVKVYGGMSFGFLTSSSFVVEVDGEEVVNEDGDDMINTTEFGAIAGVQIKVSKLVFDARYNHGLSDIMKDNEGDAVQLRTLYATVGLTF